MKKLVLSYILLAAFILDPPCASALSERIGRDIHFPKNYDARKADALRQVIRQEKYKFLDGLVSHWEPDFGTRLSFDGDAASLSDFLGDLRRLKDFSLQLVLYRGKDEDRRRDSAWQLAYSQARPNQVTVYLNVNSPRLEFSKIKFPEWLPAAVQ